MDDAQASEIAGKFLPEPDHVSETGARWWLDRNTHIPESLRPRVKVWLVIQDNVATRLITCDNDIVYESQSLEAIGCRLDLFKIYPDLLVTPKSQT